MPQRAYALHAQSVWLRTYLRAYGHDLRFQREALEQMARLDAKGLAVRRALEWCEVIYCEPDPAGSEWIVTGEDTDDRELWIRLKVAVHDHQVEVVEVSVSERDRR